MNNKTILVKDADSLVRVPDKLGSSGCRAVSTVPGIAVLAISALVAHLYFGFGPLGAVLLAPALVALAFFALLFIVFLVSAPPFYVMRFKRNRDARRLLNSILAGTSDKHVTLFLRPFDPDRGSRVKVAVSWDYEKTGMELVSRDFKRFDLDNWVDELSLQHIHVLKVSDRIDVRGGSI